MVLQPSRTLLLAATLSLALLPACSFGEWHLDDPFARGASLDERQKRYTDLVRWSAFDQAAAFVDPEVRDEFLSHAPSFRKLRFTDYESKRGALDEEKRNATVDVVYFAYATNSPIEFQIDETQQWHRDGDLNMWFVRPTFKGVEWLESKPRENAAQ